MSELNAEKVLRKIGLSAKEISAYLTLLETGPQKANFLARRVGISRANIYYHLDNLRDKGIVSIYTKETNTTFFKAEPVRNILNIFEKQKSELEDVVSQVEFVLPELEQLQKNSLAKYPKLRFYEKLSNIEDLYNELIEYDKIDAIVNIDMVEKFFPKFGLGFVNVVKKKRIESRELIVSTENSLKYKKSVIAKSHKVKILSKSFKHKTDILIFGDSVAFISYGERSTVSAFVIENKAIVQAQRETFDELWRMSK